MRVEDLHSYGVIISVLIGAWVTMSLASGESMLILERDSVLNLHLNPKWTGAEGNDSVPFRYKYGIGFHHDTHGASWSAREHPAVTLGCKGLDGHAKAALSTLCLSVVGVFLALVGHGLAAMRSNICTVIALVGYIWITIFLLVTLAITGRIFDNGWNCEPEAEAIQYLTNYDLLGPLTVPLRIRDDNNLGVGGLDVTLDPDKHFDINWGVCLLIVGLVLSLWMTVSFLIFFIKGQQNLGAPAL
eukprot:TRINITY_DN70690_c0_g1_i1.p1 TRINITY_DN70690_c0_g1~~TRINITY_DN70690_c0_g1_i1.p1  ORF type:complete len:274 (+),score=84.98 TRINITY_DN70690_c0_g1_i1:91-822(+)